MGKETKTKTLILQLRPKYEELTAAKEGDEHTYTEECVKEILFAFARDLGCDWSDKELKRFINKAFDYD